MKMKCFICFIIIIWKFIRIIIIIIIIIIIKIILNPFVSLYISYLKIIYIYIN